MQNEIGLSKNDKDFHLHLYDKLWENIIHKENRLWTFLTMYGAAIGIALGTGIADILRFQTIVILLILTYWATEITISASWWSVRNRLMINGIQQRVEAATKGVIPSSYQQPGYASESLHSISIVIFVVISIVLFSLLTNLFEPIPQPDSGMELFQVSLTYILFCYALGRVGHRQELRVKKYYELLKDLVSSEPIYWKDKDFSVEKIEEKENNDKDRLSWRRSIFLIYLTVTLMLSLRFRNILLSNSYIFLSYISLQLSAVGIYWRQWWKYAVRSRRASGFSVLFFENNPFGVNKRRVVEESCFGNFNNFKFWNFLMAIAVFCSALIPISVSITSQKIPWSPTIYTQADGIMELQKKVEELQEKITLFEEKLGNKLDTISINLEDIEKSIEMSQIQVESLLDGIP